MNGAQSAIIGMGTVCSTSRVVVDELRKTGKKVGLIKLKCFRPFPAQELRNACKGLKYLSVIDRNISLGYHGALATDIRDALYGSKVKVSGFIAGLGGRDVTPKDIRYMLTAKNRESEWINVK